MSGCGPRKKFKSNTTIAFAARLSRMLSLCSFELVLRNTRLRATHAMHAATDTPNRSFGTHVKHDHCERVMVVANAPTTVVSSPRGHQRSKLAWLGSSVAHTTSHASRLSTPVHGPAASVDSLALAVEVSPGGLSRSSAVRGGGRGFDSSVLARNDRVSSESSHRNVAHRSTPVWYTLRYFPLRQVGVRTSETGIIRTFRCRPLVQTMNRHDAAECACTRQEGCYSWKPFSDVVVMCDDRSLARVTGLLSRTSRGFRTKGYSVPSSGSSSLGWCKSTRLRGYTTAEAQSSVKMGASLSAWIRPVSHQTRCVCELLSLSQRPSYLLLEVLHRKYPRSVDHSNEGTVAIQR